MAGILPRRVVITGMGLITPLGASIESTFAGLTSKKSNTRLVYSNEVEFSSQLTVKTLGMLDDWNREEWMKKVSVVKSVYHALGLNSSEAALKDANWDPQTEEEITSTGVMYGSPRTSSPDISLAHREVVKHGYSRLDRLILAKLIPSMVVGTVSIPRHICGFSNSFCSGHSTGSHAVGDAYRTVGVKDANLIISGCSEHDHDAAVIESLIRGNYGYNLEADKNPGKATRPFDRNASGWIYSIGAGCLILEDLEHAQQRGAKAYAEVVGYSMISEGGEETAESGNGVYRAMKNAIRQSGLRNDEISAVFADASGFKKWDLGEARAVNGLFGGKVPLTAIKGGIGHMQGASSSANLAVAAYSLKNGILPPITNLENPIDVANDYVKETRDLKMKAVVANSVNHDGTGFCSLVLKSLE